MFTIKYKFLFTKIKKEDFNERVTSFIHLHHSSQIRKERKGIKKHHLGPRMKKKEK